MVLPDKATKAVLALKPDAKMSTVSGMIKEIINGSVLGNKLFSCCITIILAEEVCDTVALAQDELIKASINEAAIVKIMHTFTEKLEDIECIASLPAKRSVKVAYRGLMLQMQVKSLGEHLDLALAARLREVAVAQKLVPELPGEYAVCDDPLKGHGCEAESVRRESTARRFLLEALAEETKDNEISGDAVMAVPLVRGGEAILAENPFFFKCALPEG